MKIATTLCCALVLIAPAVAQDQSYFPLKKGAKWTYKSGTDTIVVEVKGIDKVGMEDAFELVTSLNGTPQGREHLAVRKEGIFRVKLGTDEVKPPLLVFKLPVKEKDAWTKWSVASAIGPETFKGEYVYSGEKDAVEIQKKKYEKVIRITGAAMESNGVKISQTFWYADKVGLIKLDMKLGGIEMKMELEKFEEEPKK